MKAGQWQLLGWVGQTFLHQRHPSGSWVLREVCTNKNTDHYGAHVMADRRKAPGSCNWRRPDDEPAAVCLRIRSQPARKPVKCQTPSQQWDKTEELNYDVHSSAPLPANVPNLAHKHLPTPLDLSLCLHTSTFTRPTPSRRNGQNMPGHRSVFGTSRLTVSFQGPGN